MSAEFGREALMRRLGQLAQQRRGEMAERAGNTIGRTEIALMAGIGSDSTIRDFEQGRRLPLLLTQHRLEKVLGWRNGSIGDILSQVNRKASDIRMEDVDSAPVPVEDVREVLRGIPLEILLDEVQARLADLRIRA